MLCFQDFFSEKLQKSRAKEKGRPQMLFNPVLFIVTFLICVVINLLSAVIPAYLSLRKDIVYSINKQK